MTKAENLQGIDFDWFAVDTEGRIGIFATAGTGVVPAEVLRSIEVHEKISDSVATPNWGNETVWDDYAKAGFYVFDWRGNTYIKVRSPANGIVQNHDSSELPRLSASFVNSKEISAKAF